MIRFAVIGCGTVAGYGHIPAIAGLETTGLAALCDTDEARLAKLQEQYGVECVSDDYREVLARDDIDAVAVATQVNLHHLIVMAAAEAGKHVLCEKPIADTVAEAREMVEAMQASGRLFAINFHMRLKRPFREMRRRIAAGDIGRVRVLRFVSLGAGGRWAGEDRYARLMTEGGGPILDCGVHFFDLARYLTGRDFTAVTAAGVRTEDYPNPDHVAAAATLDDGTLAVIEQGWTYCFNTPEKVSKSSLDVVGDAGAMALSGDELIVYARAGTERVAVGSLDKDFPAIYARFVESIEAGRLLEPLASGEDGLQATSAALQALDQARAGLGPR